MTTYVYDRELGKVVERKARPRQFLGNIISDVEPFQSPIDGS